MDAGPKAEAGYDLSLTEILDGDPPPRWSRRVANVEPRCSRELPSTAAGREADLEAAETSVAPAR